jgi:hypothetical protein
MSETASEATSGETGCCGPDCCALASFRCGNPSAPPELRPGGRVLDLGSGGGIDVLLSAKRVGPAGNRRRSISGRAASREPCPNATTSRSFAPPVS